jgi:very-short-patch-repair endonuclease
VAIGRFVPVHRGVYAVGHARLSLHGRWMAAVLACGPEAVLSHRSAATLWGLKTGGTRIEVSVPATTRSHRKGILLHQPNRLDDRDRTRRDEVPVTTVARTLVDLAAVVDRRRLARAFEQAERQELLDIHALEEALTGASGTRAIRELIAERRIVPETHEGLERRFIEILREAKIPLPLTNVLVEGVLVDAYWPEHKLIVELDSWTFHRLRRDQEHDHAQTLKLQLAGYRVVRLTSSMVNRETTPDLIKNLLSRSVASAAG